MPRGPRLDVEGGVYHVMARGVERRAIFRDDTDRQNFLRRLEAVAEEEDLAVCDTHGQSLSRGGAPRRALARAAVVERGIRPVEVSQYLGVSRAAITSQLRAHDT